MERQLDTRRRLIAAGETPLGWKLGLGSPAFQAQLAINGPLAGFLMQSAVLPSGGRATVTGWRHPVAEPEIAIRLRHDVPPDADRQSATAAIGTLIPAIELVDLEYAPTHDRVSDVLAANIFQRHVVLGECARAGADTADLTSHVFRDDAPVGENRTPESATGNHTDLIMYLARYLAACGERLRAGDLVMSGSTIVPQPVGGHAGFAHRLDPIGDVRISFIG